MMRWLIVALSVCATLFVSRVQASAETLLRLAQMAEHGEGVTQDIPAAIATYCEAAKAGSDEANYRLGWMYFNARGVPRDDAIAATLFQRAAKNGHEYAQANLQYLQIPASEKLPDCFSPKQVLTKNMAGLRLNITTDLDRLINKPENALVVSLVQQMAPQYGIDARLALAVIAVESGFQVQAKSPKGAMGLMQLIPGTAARFGVRNPHLASENIRGGLTYLRWLMNYFDGRVDHALAGYNAGEGAVDKYRGIPPYPETRMYVSKIMMLYGRQDMSLVQARIYQGSPQTGVIKVPVPKTLQRPLGKM